jgi:hypothetical protein
MGELFSAINLPLIPALPMPVTLRGQVWPYFVNRSEHVTLPDDFSTPSFLKHHGFFTGISIISSCVSDNFIGGWVKDHDSHMF